MATDPFSAAFEQARAAAAAGEVPVGAALTRNGEIIAAAGNRTLRDRDPTAHAEMLVIRRSLRRTRLGAARRLRSLCDARALRHVRGCDFLRAHSPALLCGERSEGRRRRERAAVFLAADLPSSRRKSMAAFAKARRRSSFANSFRRGARAWLAKKWNSVFRVKRARFKGWSRIRLRRIASASLQRSCSEPQRSAPAPVPGAASRQASPAAKMRDALKRSSARY